MRKILVLFIMFAIVSSCNNKDKEAMKIAEDFIIKNYPDLYKKCTPTKEEPCIKVIFERGSALKHYEKVSDMEKDDRKYKKDFGYLSPYMNLTEEEEEKMYTKHIVQARLNEENIKAFERGDSEKGFYRVFVDNILKEGYSIEVVLSKDLKVLNKRADIERARRYAHAIYNRKEGERIEY